ncbi:MAG: hypothetical protein LUD27_07720 [Clostridia bacterium]|nr:hypothetical protein [Clostridia bacterium]
MTEQEKLEKDIVTIGDQNYSRKSMISDIMYSCNDAKDQLSAVAKEDILVAIGWHWTENKISGSPKAKIWGCNYWSKAAFEMAFDVNGEEIRKKKRFNVNKLRHEHVVPKRVFINSILNRQGKLNEQELSQALNDKFFACVVTPEEAKKLDRNYRNAMPEGQDLFEIKEPWERYIKTGITDIIEISWDTINNDRVWIPKGYKEKSIIERKN